MPYRDVWAECTECGKEFVFRVEEQRRQDQLGQEISPPDCCPSCRGDRPASRATRRAEATSRAPSRAERSQPREKAPLGHGPHEGEVKWFSREKGYGFLVHPSGQDIFFHRTSLAPGEVEHVRDGMRVSFLIEETERGPQAVDVERLE